MRPLTRCLLTLVTVAGSVSALAQQNLLEPLPDRNQAQQAAVPGTAAVPQTAAEPTAGADTQRLSQLFYQLQVLQQEVQELRGLVEEQAYQLNRLARDQQEQYIDLDGRIASMGSGQSRPTSGSSTTSTDASTTPRASTTGSGFSSGGTSTLASRGSESERDVYTRAFDLMKARQFEESAAAFNQLIAEYPNGQYTPNAFYWLGELYLAQTDTEQARQSFAQVLNLYPDHPKVPDTLYKLGVVYHRLGDNQRAIGYFEQVGREYPNSSAAGLATRYMAELK